MSATDPMDHATLKARQRAERHKHQTDMALRVHRALSWLDRAERSTDDPDGRFIFLWIAFNAAYATEIDERYRLSEQATFQAFLGKLLSLDKAKRFDQLVWTEFSGSIRVLLDNPYGFQDFWNFQNGSLEEQEWKERFERAKAAARTSLRKQDTQTVLGIVLSRMYTLRNQLMHGGATWNSKINREQIRDCVNLLDKIVPLVIELMLDNPATLWGPACYPVVT
jgi:hypothetical protein